MENRGIVDNFAHNVVSVDKLVSRVSEKYITAGIWQGALKNIVGFGKGVFAEAVEADIGGFFGTGVDDLLQFSYQAGFAIRGFEAAFEYAFLDAYAPFFQQFGDAAAGFVVFNVEADEPGVHVHFLL